MGEKKSKVNKIIIAAALLAVAGMIGLLVAMQKRQDELSQQLQQQGQQMTEQREEELKRENAKQLLSLSRMEDGKVYLRNGGQAEADIAGVSVYVDGSPVYAFPEGTVLEPGEELAVSLEGVTYQEQSSILAAYHADGKLLAQCVIGSLLRQDDCPVLSASSGFYSQELTLEISAPEGTEVYYTCDGTVPTAESLHYEGPITITGALGKKPVYGAQTSVSIGYNPPSEVDKCTVVQAVYVDAEGRESQVARGVYFCRTDEKLAYRNVPVISLWADPEDLFDYYTGIYVTGRTYEDALARGESTRGVGNYSMGWSIVADMKFFEIERGLTYDAQVLLRVAEDEAAVSAQKNLVLTAYETEAGAGSALASLLPEKDSSMLLDKGGTDYILKARQMAAGKLLADSALTVVEVQPCALFLNGEFWGMYLMKAGDAAYAVSEKYQAAPEDIQLADTGEMKEKLKAAEEELTLETAGAGVAGALEAAGAGVAGALETAGAGAVGALEAAEALAAAADFNAGERDFYELCRFIAGSDMSVQDNYDYVKQEMDLDSYLEYVCANLYMANNGWNSSWLVWRCENEAREAEENRRWHFILKACDSSMGADSYSSYSIDTYLRPEVSGDRILSSLMENQEFARDFADTMNRMVQEYFTEEKVAGVVKELGDTYEKAMLASQNRYSQGMLESGYESRMEAIAEFCRKRPDYILQYTLEFLEQYSGEE